MDRCTECMNRKIGDIPCRTCKVGIMHGKWESPCILYTCDVCGESMVGAGFWYPCEEEQTEYRVEIAVQELSTRQMVFLARAFSVPVLQWKAALERNRLFEKGFCLSDVMELARRLEQNGILYAVFPQTGYSMYWSCGRRGRSDVQDFIYVRS